MEGKGAPGLNIRRLTWLHVQVAKLEEALMAERRTVRELQNRLEKEGSRAMRTQAYISIFHSTYLCNANPLVSVVGLLTRSSKQ